MIKFRSADWVIAIIALLLLLPLFGMLSIGLGDSSQIWDSNFWQSRYLRKVLGFSLWQAFLSTAISLSLGLLVARALMINRHFPGRQWLLKIFGLPLVVPSVVAVMAVVSVYGNQGWLPLGRALYGLNGILIAHVFFNMPLAVRLLLPVWQAIPEHHWNLADHFGFNSLQRWRLIEWPQIREALPGIGLLIFMLCLTSFAVVLTLGGGPKSTTLEVAIYQSLRFEFEPGQAVILALLQLMLCLLVAFFSHYFQSTPDVEISPDSGLSKRSHRSPIASLIILLAGIYVCLPLISMLIDAATGPVWQVITESKLWLAAFYSLAIGLSASLLSVTAGWFLLTTSSQLHNQGKKFQARWIEMAGSIVYVVPPLVIGTGYFVLLAPHVNVFEWVFPMVIGINAVMGLPFVIRSLGPAMRQHRMRYDKLCASLQITGWNRWIKIDWPMLRRPIALSLALVCALAMGDLGVIALFGTTDNTTLPLLLYQQLSAYLIPQAAVTAVMLLLFCLGMYVCIERLAGGKHDG